MRRDLLGDIDCTVHVRVCAAIRPWDDDPVLRNKLDLAMRDATLMRGLMPLYPRTAEGGFL